MELKPGYKQTEVGVIPEDWEIRSIGDLFSFKNGLNKGKIYFGSGSSIVNYMDVYSNPGIISKNIKGRVNVNNSELKTFDVKKGDVFFTRTSETVEEVGISSVMMDDPINTVFSGFLLRARPKNNSLNNQFKKYCFSSKFIRSKIISSSSYTTRALTNGRLLSKVLILCPPIQEQRAIATVLSDTDSLIESLEQLIAKKRLIKQGTMQELLTGKRRLPGFAQKSGYKQTEVGVIPEDWEVLAVDQIASIGRGRVINHKEIGGSINPKFPVYSSQTSNNGIMGFIDTYDFEGEYITWTTDGANAGTVFSRNGRFNCTNVCGTIKLLSDNNYYVSKILGLIAPSFVSRHLGNPKLMNNIMRKIKIPLPTKSEQSAIASVLSDMDEEITSLEEKLFKLRKVKQGMMQELLTGRIRLV